MHAPLGLGMSAAEVQSRCLADASASVKKQAFYMNRAIEGDNLKDALRYAALLLGELRTGELQPQRYFELYMQVKRHEHRHSSLNYKSKHRTSALNHD